MKLVKTISALLTVFFSAQLLLCHNTASAEGEWKREISLGYNMSTGNTEKTELSIAGFIKKEMEHSAFSSGGDIYYSSTDSKMDSQKWNGFARYAFDFGKEYKWFSPYQITVSHDRFADIDYRIVPSAGIGYWLSREEDWTWSVEGSLGYEMTKYRSNRDDNNSPVLVGNTFLKKKIFDNAFISENFTVTPTLDNSGTRIKSETVFTNPLREGLDLNIKYIVDHDTDPSPGKEKTDTQIMTGLKYAF